MVGFIYNLVNSVLKVVGMGGMGFVQFSCVVGGCVVVPFGVVVSMWVVVVLLVVSRARVQFNTRVRFSR